MINSMTAFATAGKTVSGQTIVVEIRSYNHRHLDMAVRLPKVYSSLEPSARQLIASRLVRGRVDVRLHTADAEIETPQFEINTGLADGWHRALTGLAKRYGLPQSVLFDHLVAVPGLIQEKEPSPASEGLWPEMKACLDDALSDLIAMRKREGAFIAEDLKKRTNHINAMIDTIHSASKNMPAIYQTRLVERIQALTGQAKNDLDPGRLAQEAAFLAEKSDISEEIVRVRSHLDQFRKYMDGKEPAGRKLNFLLQELNREFNTIGSKTEKAAVSHQVVEAKAEIEKLREQVQNIE